MHKPLAFVIEDEMHEAHIFAAAVKDAQFEVVIIRDGQEALEKLAETAPHLVVLDLRLPEVPGTMVLQAIQESKQLADTHVIVVSGDTTLTAFLRDAADLVLNKPVGYNQLRNLAARFHPDNEP